MTMQQSGVRPDYQSGNVLGFQGNIKRYDSNYQLSVVTLLHIQSSSRLFVLHSVLMLLRWLKTGHGCLHTDAN